MPPLVSPAPRSAIPPNVGQLGSHTGAAAVYFWYFWALMVFFIRHYIKSLLCTGRLPKVLKKRVVIEVALGAQQSTKASSTTGTKRGLGVHLVHEMLLDLLDHFPVSSAASLALSRRTGFAAPCLLISLDPVRHLEPLHVTCKQSTTQVSFNKTSCAGLCGSSTGRLLPSAFRHGQDVAPRLVGLWQAWRSLALLSLSCFSSHFWFSKLWSSMAYPSFGKDKSRAWVVWGGGPRSGPSSPWASALWRCPRHGAPPR